MVKIKKEMYKRGYLQDKNNILLELDKYIKRYNTVINMQNNSETYSLYNAIRRQKLDMNDLIKELGYNVDIVNPKQSIIYNSEEKIIEVINEFINKYNRFPTGYDFRYTLQINSHIVQKYGGIYNLKRLVGWQDENNLIDDNGWYNKSAYEYIVAQWLIYNNISYKREQYPFPKFEGEYRSDFMLESKDGIIIHCEVWGMESLKGYEEVKQHKINLYSKYNIPLISLDYSVFTQSYHRTQEDIYKIFLPYLNLEFKIFDNKIIIPFVKMTDEEILIELLKHSEDGETLPTVKYLKKNHIYMLYYEANKRYNGYYNFAAKFGKITTKVDSKLCGEENQKRLFKIYLQMINEFGYIPNKALINKRKEYKVSLSIETSQFQGKIGAKLAFYNYCLDNNIKLPEREVLYLSHIFDGKDKRILNFSTHEQKLFAERLFNNYNNLLISA